MASPPEQRTPIRILKVAAGLTVASGLALVVWLVDKAIRYPGVRARQFGRFGPEAPLWSPLILFVLVFLSAAAYVFWRGARRLEAGEDLFAQRHRRRPGGEREKGGKGERGNG